MLIEIAIQPSALCVPPLEEGDPAPGQSLRECVLDALQAHGVITVTDSEWRELEDVVNDLPDDERRQWKDYLHHPQDPNFLLRRLSEIPLLHVARIQDLPALPSPRLLLLHPDNATRLLTQLDCEAIGHFRHRRLNTEICRVDCIHSAELWDEVSRLANAPLRRGDDREAVWRERFASLAALCDSVVICDAYSFENFGKHGEQSALAWFLGRIASARKDKLSEVSLYSSIPGDDDGKLRNVFGAKELLRDQAIPEAQKLADFAASLGIDDLILHLTHRDVFTAAMHDRYIRFGESRIIELGTSIDIFQQRLLERSCVFNYRWVAMGSDPERLLYRDVEARLADSARDDGIFN